MTSALKTAEDKLFDAVVGGTADDPFGVLGRFAATQNGRPAVVVRTMQPAATRVELVTPGGATEMSRRRGEGLFEATTVLPEGTPANDFAYRLRIHERTGRYERSEPVPEW